MAYISRRGPTPERRERMAKALEYRRAGLYYSKIAEKLGVSQTQAHDDVMLALKEVTIGPATEIVTEEVSRLDAMVTGLWKSARSGDVKAINAMLRIMERRAKLLGLDEAIEPDNTLESRAALDELVAAINDSVPDDDESEEDAP